MTLYNLGLSCYFLLIYQQHFFLITNLCLSMWSILIKTYHPHFHTVWVHLSQYYPTYNTTCNYHQRIIFYLIRLIYCEGLSVYTYTYLYSYHQNNTAYTLLTSDFILSSKRTHVSHVSSQCWKQMATVVIKLFAMFIASCTISD